MEKIYQLVKEEKWNLDDALHEYSTVRHDMVAVLQPRPRQSPSAAPVRGSENGLHRHNAENPREKATGKALRKKKAKAKAKARTA